MQKMGSEVVGHFQGEEASSVPSEPLTPIVSCAVEIFNFISVIAKLFFVLLTS